jgi:hypothetical protein
MQFQKINDDVHIGKFFLFRQHDCLSRLIGPTHLVRERSRLTEQSREFQRLTDSSLWEMDVDLFAVPRGSLERDGQLLAIHQDFSFDLSVGLSRRQHIHQGGLTGTRRAHERGECPRLTVSKDFVEEDLGLTIGLDSVREVFPSEDAEMSKGSQRVASCDSRFDSMDVRRRGRIVLA